MFAQDFKDYSTAPCFKDRFVIAHSLTVLIRNPLETRHFSALKIVSKTCQCCASIHRVITSHSTNLSNNKSLVYKMCSSEYCAINNVLSLIQQFTYRTQVFNLLSVRFYHIQGLLKVHAALSVYVLLCTFFTRAKVHKAFISKEPIAPRAHSYTVTGSKFNMKE